jgi:hypothetical protein
LIENDQSNVHLSNEAFCGDENDFRARTSAGAAILVNDYMISSYLGYQVACTNKPLNGVGV